MKISFSQEKVAKLSFLASLLFTFLCACDPYFVWAEVDLIDEGKSDIAVKMLVFPKSLRVIENQVNTVGEEQALFSDSKRIRKTLLKVDPARIAPAKAGEPFSGIVTRTQLLKLSIQYSEDIIFIFRRVLTVEAGTLTEYKIRYQGMLYLARQKKVLVLKGNEKNELLSGSSSHQDRAILWKNLDEKGLKDLAKEARTTLHSHKFEKRQSAY
tara:strand:+ start:96 stop:731 length:636 start_codon:yes stop_codon:yes gene_type:complete